VMQEPRASFLLPLLVPRALEIALRLRAPADAHLRVEVNGQAVGDAALDATAREVSVRVPPAPLFRGDNIVTLDAPPGTILEGITLRP